MFGLEKQPKGAFVFDLEKEIKADPAHGKKILEKVESKINSIKKQLREGANEQAFNDLGVLLSGYTALQKVLKKMAQ